MLDKQWEDIIGHSTIKEILHSFRENNKIPQAIIFHGMDGIGKDFISAKFIQFLNKEILPQNQLFSSQFIKFIFPLPTGKNETSSDDPFEKLSKNDYDNIIAEINKKSLNPYHRIAIPRANVIKINSIRDINNYLSYNFSEINYRLVLISNADLMNEESQNSLLKNLEEPPPGVIFVLTTDDLSKLRETIISRCWILRIPPLSEDEVKEVLIKYFQIDNEKAYLLSKLSDGSVTRALESIDIDISGLKESVVNFIRTILQNKYFSAFKFIQDSSKEINGFNLFSFISLLRNWFVDIIRFQNGTHEEIFFKESLSAIENFNNKFNKNNKALKFLSKLDEYAYLVKNRNVNQNIIWFNLVLEISSFRN